MVFFFVFSILVWNNNNSFIEGIPPLLLFDISCVQMLLIHFYKKFSSETIWACKFLISNLKLWIQCLIAAGLFKWTILYWQIVVVCGFLKNWSILSKMSNLCDKVVKSIFLSISLLSFFFFFSLRRAQTHTPEIKTQTEIKVRMFNPLSYPDPLLLTLQCLCGS